ncbi:DEAD box helicase, putative [Plasmodium sp. DRC-Itaito]|nr:DEAD box helicase, putative [Plasmodium sp. DRC-Itaito]
MGNYINEILFLLIFFIFHLTSTKNYKQTYRYIIFFLLYFINILYALKICGNGKNQMRCCFIKNLYNNNNNNNNNNNSKGLFKLLDNDVKRNYNIIYLKKKGNEFPNSKQTFVKNTVFIERGQNDENKINYIHGNFDENVKDIKYLSDMQKNFIYLLERNNNLLVHAKTSSGKTTICLYYLILKFFYNCEFIFKEDLEREEYIMKNDYIDRNIYESKNKSRKYFNQNKYRFIPYSEKYSEISDIKEYTNLMIEKKCKTKLKKDEKVLILCPSKELCVQVAQNILSFMNNENESLIKLFIDKDYKNVNKEKQNNKEEECINKMEDLQINQYDRNRMHNNKKDSLNNMDIEENKVYMLEHYNLNADDNSNTVKKVNKINDKKNNNNNNRKLNHMINVNGARYLIGTPTCFRSYLLNLDKESLKNFLQSIKYIFYDEIDKLLPSVSKRSLLKKKKNIKRKTAYLILETLMYINKKNLIFIGCSSTLNRELHRKIFKLLCLNKNNAKKNIYILREKKNLMDKKENDGMIKMDNLTNLIDIPNNNNEKKTINEKNLCSSNELIDDNINKNIINDEQEEIENNQKFNLNYYLNEENAFQKYVIKVKLPNTIYHFYHLMTDETYENKIKEIHKIIETFNNQKILILIKNGYSLIQLKKYLEMNNIYAVLLHEKLQISLRYNNDNINNMCEHYEDIKDLKTIPNDDKHAYINKYPIIISSFDSIRGFHINNLDMVLLCNKPKNVNEYIHLCGRVGRRNKIGYSITLENDKNINIMNNWFNNIKVYFNKLSLKSDPVINEKINMEMENQEKNHFNYVASCILDELQANT